MKQILLIDGEVKEVTFDPESEAPEARDLRISQRKAYLRKRISESAYPGACVNALYEEWRGM